MKRIRQQDTALEMAIRRALFGRGCRYRLHAQVVPGTKRSVDLVFLGPRIAVFLDGCFWHGCPTHGSIPKSNTEWWLRKIDANRARDMDTNERLTRAGWQVLRIWEHEDTNQAVERILSARRSRASKSRHRGPNGPGPGSPS
ncbi:very short patch repair endonuclease [Geothrix mesophila]|uniref:very short patch repair endonuclease n=1 Tax=Geothrix mesophila TaxID=2922723 RepID=UPI003CC5EDB4